MWSFIGCKGKGDAWPRSPAKRLFSSAERCSGHRTESGLQNDTLGARGCVVLPCRPLPRISIESPWLFDPHCSRALHALGFRLGVFEAGPAFHSLLRGVVFRMWSPCTECQVQTCWLLLAAPESVCGVGPGSCTVTSSPVGCLGR